MIRIKRVQLRGCYIFCERVQGERARMRACVIKGLWFSEVEKGGDGKTD